jgi:hypothetical protein
VILLKRERLESFFLFFSFVWQNVIVREKALNK